MRKFKDLPLDRPYAKDDPERMKAYRRKWVENNKEKDRESKRAWKARNKERVKEEKAAYAKANRDKYNAWTANYRAMKLKATPVLNEFEEFAIKEVYSLASLRQKLTGVKLHVDHYCPLVSDAVCGLHNLLNLRIISAKENWSKNNRLIEG